LLRLQFSGRPAVCEIAQFRNFRLRLPDGIDLAQRALGLQQRLAEGATAEDQTQVFSRQIAIREAIAAMVDANDKDDFTGDGKPNLVKLKAKTGFHVTREEADAVFAELTQQG